VKCAVDDGSEGQMKRGEEADDLCATLRFSARESTQFNALIKCFP
jgi:hypothetical protein